MTWADQEHEIRQGEMELVRLAAAGRGDEWSRLQERMFNILDAVFERIQESTDASPKAVEASTEALKDLSLLATKWAKAKVERPTLENEKLRAEIASEFAEAKRRYAEARKLEAETRKVEVDTRNAQLVADLDILERLLKIASTMSHITFARVGNDGHLLIGPRAEQVGEPDGDERYLEET